MRLAICSVPDLCGVIALNALRPVLTQHEARIFLCDDPHPSSLHDVQYFLCDLPREVFFPLVERRSRSAAAFMTASEISREYRVPARVFTRAEWSVVSQDLVEFRPDVLFLVRFPIILKGALLSLAPLGAYNVHTGHVPGYRGLLAPFWAMLNGEKAAGCTLHRVEAGIDTGPVVGVRDLPIRPERSFLWNACHLYPLGVAMFKDVLLSLANNNKPVPGRPQSPEGGRYYRLPGDEEIARFRAAGFHFVKFDDYISLLRLFADRGDCPDLERIAAHELEKAS
jgi:methionyl-tRNA formyltransferase